METLKLGDSGNYFTENNCMLQPKCRQPYVHNDRNMKSNMLNDELNTPKLPPRPPLPKITQPSSTIDRDLAKQQQLSDWYYIKTGPKSPLPIRSDKQIDIKNETATTKINANISVRKSNENTSIDSEKNPFEIVRVSREITKNTQIIGKHTRNEGPRLCENIQMIKPDAGKNEANSQTAALNYPNVALCSGDIQNVHIPSAHQYSVNEPLCKFNYCNNSEKVNGSLKRQQTTQENHTPSSPAVITKKVHQQQSHPFYYVESSQKHNSAPRQGSSQHIKHGVYSQQKLNDIHGEQSQHLNSTVKSSKILASNSNSNSNIHKLTGIHSQQFDQNGDANSNGFVHTNVPNVISPLSASSEMVINNKRHLINQSYTDERLCRTDSNSGVECRPTVPSSPYLSAAHQSKVSHYAIVVTMLCSS